MRWRREWIERRFCSSFKTWAQDYTMKLDGSRFRKYFFIQNIVGFIRSVGLASVGNRMLLLCGSRALLIYGLIYGQIWLLLSIQMATIPLSLYYSLRGGQVPDTTPDPLSPTPPGDKWIKRCHGTFLKMLWCHIAFHHSTESRQLTLACYSLCMLPGFVTKTY